MRSCTSSGVPRQSQTYSPASSRRAPTLERPAAASTNPPTTAAASATDADHKVAQAAWAKPAVVSSEKKTFQDQNMIPQEAACGLMVKEGTDWTCHFLRTLEYVPSDFSVCSALTNAWASDLFWMVVVSA